MRPSKRVNALIRFLLAYCASKHGIDVHGFVFMSGHFHLLLTDGRGALPAFMRDFNALLARALNSMHGDWETFWAPGSYNALALFGLAAIFRRLVYIATNPVAALLVRTHTEWPGVISKVAEIGREQIYAKRPKIAFFRETGAGCCPKSAKVQITIPPALRNIDPDELRQRLAAAVARREAAIQRRVRAKGLTFRGAKAVRAIDRQKSPATKAPRRKLRPAVSCLDPARRILELGILQQFRADNAAASRSFRAGDRDTIFPYGSYLLVRQFSARVAAPPGDG